MNYAHRLIATVLALFTIGTAYAEEQEQPEPGKETIVVVIKTNKGNISLELDEKKAPITVKNFLQYVDDGHYNGTIFHRVIKDFMIQGGGMTAEMRERPTRDSIKNEAQNGLKNLRGTIAMARTSVVDSATSQFFINLKDNTFLNHTSPDPRGYGYCVFGRVIDGMDVVDDIATVRTGHRGGHGDVPVEAIEIISIERQ